MKEKANTEQIIYDFLVDWNNISTMYYIISETIDEMTQFVTFEYLNKILLSDKGFSNFPEKSNNFSWKEDLDNDKIFEPSTYNQFLEFLFQLIKSKRISPKTFIRNSLCNLISQAIRIIWNEFGVVGSVLERIFELLVKSSVLKKSKNKNL